MTTTSMIIARVMIARVMIARAMIAPVIIAPVIMVAVMTASTITWAQSTPTQSTPTQSTSTQSTPTQSTSTPSIAPAPNSAPAQNPLTQQNPLADLKDIHLPKPIPAWPPAPGWWIIATASIVGIILSFVLLKKRWQRLAFKREALKILAELEHQYMGDANHQLLLDRVSVLMRRVCLTKFPRKQVAGLTGEQWLSFLDTHGDTNQFTRGVGNALVDVKFKPNATFDAAQFILICRQWIKKQK